MISSYNRENEKKGFECLLSSQSIDKILDAMKDNYFHKNTNPDHFKAIFKILYCLLA